MNLLFRILYAQKCTSTHHHLAMDALRYLNAPDSDRWRRLFLAEIEQYLDGAKAPDKKFRDFRNHVLHVSDNYWGGAVPAAELWYGRLVECLRHQQWRRAAYCAGVLSHYVTDPFMPLHTGQTEDEGAVHKLIEWGTAKAYRDLVATLPAARGIHNWKPPAGASDDWLALLIIEGATHAHRSYDILIDHYDPVRGQRKAVDGMDTVCRETIAHLLGRCIKAVSWVMNQAIKDAAVEPPAKGVSVATVLSGLSTPVFFLTRRLASREDRATVRAIINELREKGRVVASLPEDDRQIRAAHASEVLGITEQDLLHQRVRRPGTQFRIATPEEQREKRFRKHRASRSAADTTMPAPRLALHDDVVDAPSIGPRTAKRLRTIGIETVAQLLQADPDQSAAALQQRWLTGELFVAWQQQARFVCEIPDLRGMDAQLLTGVGITCPADLAAADSHSIADLIEEFAVTSEGERVVGNGHLPDQRRIARWIDSASKQLRRVA